MWKKINSLCCFLFFVVSINAMATEKPAAYTADSPKIITISGNIPSQSTATNSQTYESTLSLVSPPSFSLESGQYVGVQTVTLSLPKDGSATSVQYTVDGSDPTNSDSTPIIIISDKVISLTSTANIKAVAVNDAKEYSDVVSRKFDIIIPEKTTRAALAATFSNKVFALSADDLAAIEVHAVNGKIVNADSSTKLKLSWNIHEIGDSAIIENNLNKHLTGGGSTTLDLTNSIFKWNKNIANNSWEYANRSFIYRNSSGGVFKNYLTKYIKHNGYQSDWTKAYTFAEGYVRTGLIPNQLATICLSYSVAVSDFKGANFFEIAGVIKATADMNVDDITGIAIKPVKELTAGKPYLMQATENVLVAAYSGERVAESAASTGLVGNISGETITVGPSDNTHWIYAVSWNKLRKITGKGKAEIANNRAYLNLYGVPVYVDSNVSAKIIYVNDNPTGIKDILESSDTNETYRLNGIKVSSEKATKGIYIKGGRKYIVK